MKTATKVLSTTVAAAALFGMSGLTTAALAAGVPATTTTSAAITGPAPVADEAGAPAPHAAALDDDGTVHAAETRTFTVTNLTGERLRLTGTARRFYDTSPMPADGTVVAPGGEITFDPTWWFLDGQVTTATFDVLDDSGRTLGQVKVRMEISGFAQLSSSGEWTSGRGEVVGIPAGDRLAVLDAKGTVHEVSGSDAQATAEVLQRFAGLNSARSTFAETAAPRPVMGPRHAVGDVVFNNGPEAAPRTLTWTETFAETDSLQVSASVKASILKVVEMTLQTTYQHQWTSTKAFATSQTVPVRPYYKSWLEIAQAYQRFTGDYRVELGNTTWVMHGVHFDFPDEDGQDAVIIQSIPMTDQELEVLEPGETQVPIATAVRLSDSLSVQLAG